MAWKQTKYRNVKIENPKVFGMWFDSKLEKAVWDILFLSQCGHEISELHHHPGTVFLGEARIQYRPDFSFINKSGIIEFAEAKGIMTPAWRIKRKLWISCGPGKLFIYQGNWRNPVLTETIVPKEKT